MNATSKQTHAAVLLPSTYLVIQCSSPSLPLFFGVGINGLIGSKRLFQVIGHPRRRRHLRQCSGALGRAAQRGLLAVHGGFWIAGHPFEQVRKERRTGWRKGNH